MPKRHRTKDESPEKKHKVKKKHTKKHSKKHKKHHGDKKERNQEMEDRLESRSSLQTEQQELKETNHGPPAAESPSEGQIMKQSIGPQLPFEFGAAPTTVPPTETKPVRVARGPERPPQEILDLSMETSDEPLVGPMPPEIELEAENESEYSKFREVARVIKLVGSDSFVDPFQVLDLNKEAQDSQVKKRYWKLSLMVHPDKCGHPMAQKAFQAVNDAFKSLGSSAGRALIQEKKDEAHLKKFAELEAERLQRQHEWAVVRGDPDAVMMAKGPQVRETWMTELPPERRKPTVALQVNKSTFSQKGIHERGDTSAWTNTPTSKSSSLSIGPRMHEESHKPPVASVDPGRLKKKSLVEQHLEKLKESKRAKKKSESKSGTTESTGFKGWKPFDREKDLEIQRDKTKDWEAVVKDAKSLSSRFH